MKKLLLFLPFLFLIISCGLFDDSDDAGEVNPDGNDEIALATPVTIGTVTNFAITPVTDVDIYKIVIEQGSLLRVLCSNVSSQLNLYVRITDEEGDILSSVSSDFDSDSDNIELVYSCKPGTYYIHIQDKYNVHSSTTEMALSFTTDVIDTFEYNNDLVYATPILLEQEYQAKILPEGDNDYYSFTLTKPSIVNFVIDSISSLLDFYLLLYDVEGTKIKHCDARNVSDTIWGACLSAGTYYLNVHDRYNIHSSDKPYQLTTKMYTMDTTEWNNSFETACGIDIGSQIEANIYPQGDIDYFSFDVTSEDTVSIYFDSLSSKVDFKVEIVDNENTYVNSYRLQGSTDTIKTVLGIGRYCLKLTDSYNVHFSEKKYNFIIR